MELALFIMLMVKNMLALELMVRKAVKVFYSTQMGDN